MQFLEYFKQALVLQGFTTPETHRTDTTSREIASERHDFVDIPSGLAKRVAVVVAKPTSFRADVGQFDRYYLKLCHDTLAALVLS